MALLKNMNDKPGKPQPLPDAFSIEHQFNLYLQRVKLDPVKMSAVQYRETKRAFVGAYAALLMTIKHDLEPYTEAEAVAIFQNMENQVLDFVQQWKGQKN